MMKLLLFSTQSCSSINILPENVLSREQSATKYSNGIKVERKNAGRNSATQTEMTGKFWFCGGYVLTFNIKYFEHLKGITFYKI